MTGDLTTRQYLELQDDEMDVWLELSPQGNQIFHLHNSRFVNTVIRFPSVTPRVLTLVVTPVRKQCRASSSSLYSHCPGLGPRPCVYRTRDNILQF